jgi:hypothetical protein
MLVLAVTFTAVSANAQTDDTKRIDAKVPFEFQVGQKSYPAGNYVMKISQSATNVVTLSLQDNEGNQLENVLLAANGDVSKNDYQLIFALKDKKHVLSKVLTDRSGFSLVSPKVKQDSAKKNKGAAGEAAAVAMK